MFWPGKVKLAKLDSIIARNKKNKKIHFVLFLPISPFSPFQVEGFRHAMFY